MFFKILYVCFPVSYVFVFYFVYSVFFVFSPLLYIAVSFLFLYKFTDHCHRVENQLQ
jgi:hypothetical protein